MAIFAKYEGIDGESQDANHQGWINILSLDWGGHRQDAANGGSRRRGRAIIEDFVLAMAYEKASPKLQETCLKGKVIPKLEVELTSTFGNASETYLKYELKNVAIISFQTNAEGGDEMAPAVILANNFEEIKVVYSKFDETGSSQGKVETKYKLKK
ncbi:MAG: type VI secretion system tube protein Hcp [Gammaproteobacteria bacterium]|nr:type VI secretion system tube protein Hcp [Gammaproteobacteria bacterium]